MCIPLSKIKPNLCSERSNFAVNPTLIEQFKLMLKNKRKDLLKLSWASCQQIIFGMAVMPFLWTDPFFTKISYHWNVSLAVYLQIFNFSFCQKNKAYKIIIQSHRGNVSESNQSEASSTSHCWLHWTCVHTHTKSTHIMSPPCQFYNTGFLHFKPSLYNYHAEVI